MAERKKPSVAKRVRDEANVDYAGMDPEMARTMQPETKRRVAFKKSAEMQNSAKEGFLQKFLRKRSPKK